MVLSRIKLVVILLMSIIITAGSFYVYGEKTAVPDSVTLTKTVEAPKTIEKSNEDVVYISGAVCKPGVVKLPAGSRVENALEMVGGLSAEADTVKINLAEKVKDGMHIHVPSNIPSRQGEAVSGLAAKHDGKININYADVEELDKLPGIGPMMAARIVEYRKANGNFISIEDIKNVKGIGEAKFQKLKDKITI